MEKKIAILLTLICVIVIIPVVAIAFVHLPAAAQYNRLFRSRVVMAYDQATFEGMKEQVLILWEQMNITFKGFDYAHTYNTPWFWEQTYDNSLAAQQDYLRQLVNRLDSYSSLYKKMLENMTNPVFLEDWYYKSIQNFRDEMKREGGLDWAIHGAWLLNFAPAAYWLPLWLIPLEILLVVLAFITWIKLTE